MKQAVWLALVAALSSACASKSEDEPAQDERQVEHKLDPSAASADPAASTDKAADDSAGDVSIIKAKTKNGDETQIAVQAPKGWTVLRAPSTPDPHAGKYSLREATEGLAKQGTLVAQLETALGSITCDLFEREKPITVANFVGLARGKRKYWDGDALEWVGKPFYDGTVFHRVMPGFMIQGGDRSGNGLGGIGYTIPDEILAGDKHDRPGLLCMANRNAGFNGSQFFITESPAPHVDGRYTIFGQCSSDSVSVVRRISHAASSGKPDFKPTAPVVLSKVEIKRVAGGAAGVAKQVSTSQPGVIPVGRAVEIGPDGTPKRPK